MADAAALLHGEGRFLEAGENAVERIRDGAHHETVEQGHLPPGPGARQNAPGGQETIVLQNAVESLRPACALANILGFGDGARHPPPAILYCLVGNASVLGLETIFHIPDLPGNRIEERLADGIHFGTLREVLNGNAF